jgi:WXG100 family type VII secretion target
MAGQILVSPDTLREHSTHVGTNAQQAQSDFTAMRARLSELSSAFQGQAAEMFTARFEEWNTSATSLIEALQALGQFLNQAAETVEQADAQLASGLGG